MIDVRIARVLAALAVVGVTASGCRQRIDGNARSGEAACAVLDSLLAASGLPRGSRLAGDATIDIEQFRFRGHFQLEVAGTENEATLELGGSTLFGGHREDVVVSLVDDTLRVFDRERGRLYEGESLDDLIRDATGTRADWALVMAEVVAFPPRCPSVESVVLDGDGLRGAGATGPFRMDVENGRVTRTVWPDPIAGSALRDRLEVRYRWRGDRIEEITGSLPARGWRVRLAVATMSSSAN